MRDTNASDIDLAVLLERRLESMTAEAELVTDLQALISGQDVDVALLNGADPLLLNRIAERCRLLYGSPRALCGLKMYAFKRDQDHRRFLAMERSYVSGKIRALAQ